MHTSNLHIPNLYNRISTLLRFEILGISSPCEVVYVSHLFHEGDKPEDHHIVRTRPAQTILYQLRVLAFRPHQMMPRLFH